MKSEELVLNSLKNLFIKNPNIIYSLLVRVTSLQRLGTDHKSPWVLNRKSPEEVIFEHYTFYMIA